MSETREAYRATKARRNQVNVHLTDEEMQLLMAHAMNAGQRVGVIARLMIQDGIKELRNPTTEAT